jgi:hypothetical protein
MTTSAVRTITIRLPTTFYTKAPSGEQMLNQPTIEKLQAMKLHGMAEAFQEQIEIPDSSQLSFEERLGLLVDRQWTWKEARASHDGCNWPDSRNAASWKTLIINIHAA